MSKKTFWTALAVVAGLFVIAITVWPKNNAPATMVTVPAPQAGPNNANPTQYPQPTASPESGPVGTVVTIHGAGFTPTGNDIVFFNMSAPSLKNLPSHDGNTITFTVPAQMSMYCQGGSFCPQFAINVLAGPPYQIKIISANGYTQYVEFTVTGTSTDAIPPLATSTTKSATTTKSAPKPVR